MVPTAIENSKRKVIRVIAENESPGVIKLGREAFVNVVKHPKKPGHKVSRVAWTRTTSGRSSHIGPFVTYSKRIGRGYSATWISEKDAAQLAQK